MDEISLELEHKLLTLLEKFNTLNIKYCTVVGYPDGIIRAYASNQVSDKQLEKLKSSFLDTPNTPTSSTGSPIVADEAGMELRRCLPEPTVMLQLCDPEAVNTHLCALFKELQQIPCKALAKAWIRVIEPKKQTKYPYKGSAETRPPWWPRDIRHVEPDHLLKEERVKLMIHFLLHVQVPMRDLRECILRVHFDNQRQRIAEEAVYVASALRTAFEEIRVSQFNVKRGTKREDPEDLTLVLPLIAQSALVHHSTDEYP